MKLICSRLFLPAISLLTLLPLCQAAVVDVKSFGATGNGTTDDTAAIQNAINASAVGDTVNFPSGTYKILSGITFKSSRNYTGQSGAILSQATVDKFCASSEYDNGKDVLVTGLTFQGGGFSFSGSGNVPANNIDFKQCTFRNITNSTYPYNQAIYIPIGAANCNVTGNTFSNISDNGLIAWNLNTCSITDNFFTGVNEGSHLNGSNNPNNTIARNTGVNMHRMGFEVQGSGYTNFLVEDNHFSHWSNPYNDSFGLSIVQGNSGTNSVTTQYNTVLGRPDPASGSRYGFGIEVGSDELVQNNFCEGDFWHDIVIGGSHSTITNNIARGPANGGYQQPATIVFEPGGDSATVTITGNTLTNTPNFLENPTSLRSTVSGKDVTLNWVNNDTKQTGVEVQRHIPGGAYSVIATLGATASSYTDKSTNANTAYAYRIRAFDTSGNLTFSPSVLATTGSAAVSLYETENLVLVGTSGDAHRVISDARFSNGAGTILDATAVGDYVIYKVPAVSSGTYDLRIGIKDFNPRGIWQNSIAPFGSTTYINHGPVVDEYNGNEVFTEVDLGSVMIGTTGDKSFKFTVTGKNAASSGYSIAFDYIKLIQQ